MAAKFTHKLGKRLLKEFEEDISKAHLRAAFDDAINRIPRKDLKKELRHDFDKYYEKLRKIMKGNRKSVKNNFRPQKKTCTADEFVQSEKRGGIEVGEVNVKDAETENQHTQFPWLLKVMKELRKPGNIEDPLRLLFEESDSDVQSCLEKQKPNRAKRLALEIRKVITACYMKLKLNPLLVVAEHILHLFSALLSVYIDLCSVYCIKKVEKKKKYGNEVGTYVRSILINQPETQLEVILQSDTTSKQKTKFLNPFIRRCIFEQPASVSHHHYLKQVLVIQKVKDRFDPTLCAELVAHAKKLTPLDGFYDWLQKTSSGVLNVIKLKKEKAFKSSKISVHIVLCADGEVIDLLNECLLAKSTQDVPGIEEVTEEAIQDVQFQHTDDLFFIDTGKTSVDSVQPSTSQLSKNAAKSITEKKTIKTIEDLQKLIVQDESKQVKEPCKLDSKLVNSITKSQKVKEFFQEEIVSITPVSLEVPAKSDEDDSDSNIKDTEDEADLDQDNSESKFDKDEDGGEKYDDLAEDYSETENSSSENEYELEYRTEDIEENEQFTGEQNGSNVEADNQEIDADTSMKSDKASLSDGVFVSESEPDTSADLRLKSTVHKIVRNLESGSKSDSSPIKQSRSSGNNDNVGKNDACNNQLDNFGNFLEKSHVEVSTPESKKKTRKKSSGSDGNMSAKKSKDNVSENAQSIELVDSDIEETDIYKNFGENSVLSDEGDEGDKVPVREGRKQKECKNKTPSSDRKLKKKLESLETLNKSSESDTENDIHETDIKKEKCKKATSKGRKKLSKELTDESEIDDKENLTPEKGELYTNRDDFQMGEKEEDEFIPGSPEVSINKNGKSVFKGNEKTEMDSNDEDSVSKDVTLSNKKHRKSSSQSESPKTTAGKKRKTSKEVTDDMTTNSERSIKSSDKTKKRTSDSTNDGNNHGENISQDSVISEVLGSSSAKKKKKNSNCSNEEFDAIEIVNEDYSRSETLVVTSAKKKKRKSKSLGENQEGTLVKEDIENYNVNETNSLKKKQDTMSITDIFNESKEVEEVSAGSDIETASGSKRGRKNKSGDKEPDHGIKVIGDPSNPLENFESSSAKKKKRKSRSINEEFNYVKGSQESDENIAGRLKKTDIDNLEMVSPKRKKMGKRSSESADDSFTKVKNNGTRSSSSSSERKLQKELNNSSEETESMASTHNESNDRDNMETSDIVETINTSCVGESESSSPRKKKKNTNKGNYLINNSKTTPPKKRDESSVTEKEKEMHVHDKVEQVLSRESDDASDLPNEVLHDLPVTNSSTENKVQNKSIIVSSDDSDMEVSEVPDLKQHLKPFTFVTEKIALPPEICDVVNKSDIENSDKDDIEIVSSDSDKDSVNETVINTFNKGDFRKKTNSESSTSSGENTKQSSNDLPIDLNSTTSKSQEISEFSDLDSIDSNSRELKLVIAESDIESTLEIDNTTLTLEGSPKVDNASTPIENMDSPKSKSRRLSLRKSPRSSELAKETNNTLTENRDDMPNKGKEIKSRRTSLRQLKAFESKEQETEKSTPDHGQQKPVISDETNQQFKSPRAKSTRKDLEKKKAEDGLESNSGVKHAKSPTNQKSEEDDFQVSDIGESQLKSPRRSVRQQISLDTDEHKTGTNTFDIESSPTKKHPEDEHDENGDQESDLDTNTNQAEFKPTRRSISQLKVKKSDRHDTDSCKTEPESKRKGLRKQKSDGNLHDEIDSLEDSLEAGINAKRRSPRKQQINEKVEDKLQTDKQSNKESEVEQKSNYLDVDTDELESESKSCAQLVSCEARGHIEDIDKTNTDFMLPASPSKAVEPDSQETGLDAIEPELKSRRSSRKSKSDESDDQNIGDKESEIKSLSKNLEENSSKDDDHERDMNTVDSGPKSRRSLRQRKVDDVDDEKSQYQPDKTKESDIENDLLDIKGISKSGSLAQQKPETDNDQETDNAEPELKSTRRSLRQHKIVALDDKDTEAVKAEVTSTRRSLRQRKSITVSEPDTDTETDIFVKKTKKSTKKEPAPLSDSKQSHRSTGNKSALGLTSESDAGDSEVDIPPARPRRSVLFKTAMEGIEENTEETGSSREEEETVAKTPIREQRPRVLSASTSKKIVKKDDKRASLRKRRLSGELLASETNTVAKTEEKAKADDKDRNPSPKGRRTSQRRKQIS